MAAALLTKEALGVWRTNGRCADALVLMLQISAPGAGCVVVGHDGRPKSAWHALRCACRPLRAALRDLGQHGVVRGAVNEMPRPRAVR